MPAETIFKIILEAEAVAFRDRVEKQKSFATRELETQVSNCPCRYTKRGFGESLRAQQNVQEISGHTGYDVNQDRNKMT